MIKIALKCLYIRYLKPYTLNVKDKYQTGTIKYLKKKKEKRKKRQVPNMKDMNTL